MKKRNLKKPIISALEQRVLFDGAAVETAVDVLDNSSFSSTTNDATNNSAENIVHEAQAVQSFERPRREVAFVDVTVSDYQTLVDGVGEGVETYLVSSMNEISSILKNETNIDAIHILSHGNTGEIIVGNDVLNQSTLNNFDAVLQSMKSSLGENGDILLYGCNVASDGTGQEFIDLLSSETQADVAASNDVTGNSNVNGDWDLEIETGSIETSTIVVENYSSRLADVTYTENDSATLVANNVPISSGTNFSGGYVEFSLSGSTSTETLSLVKASTASIVNGQISIVGNGVYIGNGSVAVLVGSIDNTYNGENGQKLRINFSNTFTNRNFTDTTATQTGTVVDISGWTVYLQQLMLGQNGVARTSTIDGWATPIDSTPTPSNPNNPSQVSRGDDYTPSGAVYSYAFEDGGLRLYSSGMTTAAGGDIVHGPYVVSDSTVTLSSGDSVSFDWKAQGGDDAYDIYAYLLNVDTGATVELLNQTGVGRSATAWATKNTNINTAGTYKFVFVSGTFDETFGQAAGASLYIDNIVVTQAVMPPAISGSVLQYITRNLTYYNSSETLNTLGETKNISINGITSGGVTDVSLSRSIEIIGVNDLPYILGKETVTVNEDTSITISGLTVGDKDIGSGNLTVTIDASHGTLSLGNSTGVTTSWDAVNKTFQITGTVTNLNNALATLRYQGDANWFGDDPLTITIKDGQGSGEQPYRINQTGKFFNPDNGHYYEFVSASGITWDQAKTDAEARTLYGLKGYLVTITSDSENTLITSMAGGNGWIGASDAQSEGIWKWVTGPEAGTQFWTGDTYAGTNSTLNYGSSYNGQYSNWANGEPNNSDSSRGGEDVAHFYYNGVNAGKWNDFAATNNSAIAGYIVEYGGYGGTLAAANLTVRVLSVNDLPVNNIPTARTTNEDVNIVFSTANGNVISISDNDTLNHPSVILTTTLSIGSEKGTLTLTEGSEATITNNGSTTVQITGTVAQINASLEGLTYTPTLNANGTAYTTLVITTNDGIATDTDSVIINITPVDDKPVANSMAATVGVGSAQLFSYFQPNFFDVEGDSPVAIKLLSSPDKGQFEYWNGTSWKIVTINETTPLVVAMSDMNNYRFNALSESNTSTTVQWQVKTAGDTSDTGWSNTATGTISILSYADNTTPSVSITYPNETTTGTPSTTIEVSPDSTNPTSSVTTVTSNNVITINEDGQTATITLTYSDSVTPAQFMQGIMTSSNTRLIDFSDSSTYTMTQSVTNNVGTITLILKPKANMYGETLITLGAFDGQKTTQETFILRVNSVNEQAIVDNFTRTINEDTSFSFATINPADIYHDANDVNNNANVSAVDYKAQMAIIQDAMGTDKQTAKAAAITALVDANYFPKSFIIDTLPTNGDLYLDGIKIKSTNYTIAIANLEKLVYQPDLNYFGTDSFIWYALDKEVLATTIKTATFTINAVNDAPVFTNQSENTVEGNTITGGLPASDVDSASISFSINGTAPTGFILNNDGSYSFDSSSYDYIGEGETDTIIIPINVTDTEGLVTTANFSVTITGTNDAPTIQIIDVNANIIEGTTLNDNGSVTFADLDLTDRPVATEITKSVNALAQDGITSLVLTEQQRSDIENAFSIINVNTNVNNGIVTWDYSISEDKINFLGKDEVVTAVFTISVTDDEGATATQDVTVTISGNNDAPTVSFENIDFEIPFGEVYNKDISSLFSDKDLTDKFKFEATNLPLGLTIDSNTGIISGRVAQSGNFVIVIKGIDSAGASVTRTYNMLVIAPAQIAESVKPSLPSIPTNNDTNTNNSTNSLNNFTDSTSNLGVLNFNSNDGLSVDTGIGFLDTSNNSSTNGGELNSSTNQNGEIDGSNNNSNNTSNPNDSKGVLQASVDLNVLTNGQVVFNEGNQDSFSIVGITIEDIKVENNFMEIKVVDTNLSQNFIVTQIDGTPLPAGLFFDPKTGNITGTIPEDLEKLEISIKAINQDGTTRVLNLKLDLKELKNKNQADADEKYMGLKEQIAMENQKLDGYGSYLTRLFA